MIRFLCMTLPSVLLWGVLSFGCAEGEAVEAVEASREVRIVTLAPALTQVVVDLGLGDRVVGVGMHDAAVGDGVGDGTPVVGTYVQPDVEAVLAARPTVVLMMTGKEGVPVRLRETAVGGAFAIEVFEQPRTEAEVWRMVREVGRALGRGEEAERVVERGERELAGVTLEGEGVGVGGGERPRVLPLISLEPMMATGPGTMLGRLVTRVGGLHVLSEGAGSGFGTAGGLSVEAPTLDREVMLTLNPGVIVLLMPGAPPLSPADDPLADPRLAVLRGLPVDAVRDGRVLLIDDVRVLLPSSNIGRTAGLLREAIKGRGAGAGADHR